MSEKACLIVIDGWGVSSNTEVDGDAIVNASTPVMTHLSQEYSNVPLLAHGLAVGLPDGLMGNSEVGHLNIGAGRVVYQDIVRIDLAIQNKSLEKTQALTGALDFAKANGNRIHFMGLVSDGGVHSHMLHLLELLRIAKAAGIKEAFVHFFADGRDTTPKSAIDYMKQLLDFMEKENYGKVSTIIGRYYAMDRDKRWERTTMAYEALVSGKGTFTSDPIEAINACYEEKIFDEFIKPIVINDKGVIKNGDVVVMFNYRSDRMRQIAECFTGSPLPFTTEAVPPQNIHAICMTSYNHLFKFPVMSPPQSLENVLAECLGKNSIPQCHIAETEKYAHVTFFFNGGREIVFHLEDRVLIPSPKVATYDLKPEMSVHEVASAVIDTMKSEKYPFVMCNFAPPDMVGHTGNYQATLTAVEATDKAIGNVYEACKTLGYTLFVTSDHGNAEKMKNENGGPHTAHTTSKVPFICTSKEIKLTPSHTAALCDVAPTILDFMGLQIPQEMNGKSLISK